MTAHASNARSVIIDCDPGQDDAVNLILAFASPEAIDIRAVTTVAGNVNLDLTSRNARIVREMCGREDIPVYAGCDRPLVRAPIFADHVHGPTGLDGADIFEPKAPLAEGHAVDVIIALLVEAKSDEITLVITGPCTNIATAFARAPEIVSKVREIVLMGGSMREGGNITPSAEFNMFADPHAAKAVFACGRPITAMGLDVTHQVLCTPDRMNALRALKSPVADAIVGMMTFSGRHDIDKYDLPGGPLHDPCTAAYLLAPDIFTTKPCFIDVEADSPLTLGHTAVDFWGVTGEPANANWAYGVDSDAFFTLLLDRVKRL